MTWGAVLGQIRLHALVLRVSMWSSNLQYSCQAWQLRAALVALHHSLLIQLCTAFISHYVIGFPGYVL
jgi:hypothetical protein